MHVLFFLVEKTGVQVNTSFGASLAFSRVSHPVKKESEKRCMIYLPSSSTGRKGRETKKGEPQLNVFT